MEKKPLPKDWISCALADIGLIVAGGTPSTSVPSYWNGNISWITPSDLSNYNQKYISKGKKSITNIGLKNSSAKVIPKGSVLFSSRAPIGYVVIASDDLTTNQGFKSIVPYDGIDSSYLYHYLKSIKETAISEASGTTFKEISASVFSLLPFLLPPLPEQCAIVAKLETLLSKLDHATATLIQTKKQLKTYRQAVLKAAFTGKLTEEWRKQQVYLPTIEELLKTVQSELESLFIRSNKGKGTRELRALLHLSDEQIPKEGTNHTEDKQYHWVDLEFEYSYYPITTTKIKIKQRDYLEIGDYPIIDQGADLIGGYYNNPEFLITDDPPFVVFGDHTKVVKYVDFMFIPGADGIKVLKPYSFFDPKLFYYFLKVMPIPDKGYARHFQYLSKIKIPLPSLAEQGVILEKVESRFSVADQLDKTLDESLSKTEALKQSLLKQAFEGKLLTEGELEDARHAADWEPAGMILSNIKETKKNQDNFSRKKYGIGGEKMQSTSQDIIETLMESDIPIEAYNLWKSTKYSDDIEEFYVKISQLIDSGKIEEFRSEDGVSYLRIKRNDEDIKLIH